MPSCGQGQDISNRPSSAAGTRIKTIQLTIFFVILLCSKNWNLVYTFWHVTLPKTFRGYEWCYLIAGCGCTGREKVWCIVMLSPVIEQHHKTQTRDWYDPVSFVHPLQPFWRSILPPSWGYYKKSKTNLKMKAASYFKKSVTNNKSTRNHTPEDCKRTRHIKEINLVRYWSAL